MRHDGESSQLHSPGRQHTPPAQLLQGTQRVPFPREEKGTLQWGGAGDSARPAGGPQVSALLHLHLMLWWPLAAHLQGKQELGPLGWEPPPQPVESPQTSFVQPPLPRHGALENTGCPLRTLCLTHRRRRVGCLRHGDGLPLRVHIPGRARTGQRGLPNA